MIKIFFSCYRIYRLDAFLKANQDKIHVRRGGGVDTVFTESASFQFAVPRKGCAVTIGNGCRIGCNFIFESEQGYISIGDRTFINSGTNLISRTSIHIGNDVTIAWGCYIYDHDSHSIDWRDRIEEKQAYGNRSDMGALLLRKSWKNVRSASIHIGDKAWLGFNVIVLKGVSIGEGAIIGAGSVVTSDIPAYCIAAGNPAAVVKRLHMKEVVDEDRHIDVS